METGPYYLFDPVQLKEYGGNFYQGVDFYYRFIQNNKLFFKNIYIPFGPCCKTEKGFENFLIHIKSMRFSKIKIDLPMIYEKKISENICNKLLDIGFKKKEYILQDEETLLVFPADLKLDNKKRNIIKFGKKFVNVEIKKNLLPKDIDGIYKIYIESSKRIGYKPKQKSVFVKLAENCLVSVAFNKISSEIEGYVFGYFINRNKILLNMFTGVNEDGRSHKIGHCMHYDLFQNAFEDYNIDFIDLRGASRTKNRTYIHFKRDFSHNFYSLPGSFEKIIY